MASGTANPIRMIASPRCPKCGARMSIVCISLDLDGNDLRVYECAHCQHEITEVVKLRKAS